LHGRVAEYSRAVSHAERFQLLSSFQNGSIKVLVASDAITRGMDIADVDNIINYEPPVYAKTYVHRAGRTARAGKQGWYLSSI
jgi:ATP-dependent RNA helicase DDX51/DBP6